MFSRVLQEVRAELDPAVVPGVVVQNHIPASPFQSAQVIVPVSDEVLHIRDVRFRPTPGEDGDLVAPFHGVSDHARTDESGSSKDEDPFRCAGMGWHSDYSGIRSFGPVESRSWLPGVVRRPGPGLHPRHRRSAESLFDPMS